MTGPVDDPLPAPGADPALDDVAALEAELADGDGGRVGRYARRARGAVRALAVMVVATGVLALVVGVIAWRDRPIVLVVVVVLCLPAIAGPIYVARRADALADAAAHPRQVAAQAQQLVGRVRHSTELQALAGRVAKRRSGDHRGPISGAGPGRIRGALEVAKLASTVVGQAQPDGEHHPLLVPFTPERLARTWSAVGISLWGWALAAAVLAVSVVALLVGLI